MRPIRTINGKEKNFPIPVKEPISEKSRNDVPTTGINAEAPGNGVSEVNQNTEYKTASNPTNANKVLIFSVNKPQKNSFAARSATKHPTPKHVEAKEKMML